MISMTRQQQGDFNRCCDLFARHGRALTGVSPEHARIVGSV
jgi:hypothetical protein